MIGINNIGSDTNLLFGTARKKSIKEKDEFKKAELKKDSIEQQLPQNLKNDTDKTQIENSVDSKKDEAQTEIFINSKGEKIVSVKTSFGGIQYIKIGEVSDSLLNYSKVSANIEALEKAYNII